MYKDWSSENVVTNVVMKGCPATAASVLRSFRTCSTCLSFITKADVNYLYCRRRENGMEYMYRLLCGELSMRTLYPFEGYFSSA